MNKGELIDLLRGIDDDAEILLFPEMEGTDDNGINVESGPGIGIFCNDTLLFLGEVEQVELCPSIGDE